jgi:hypothetical protein
LTESRVVQLFRGHYTRIEPSYYVGVNQYEIALLVLFLPFYLVAGGFCHYMVLIVNRGVPESKRAYTNCMGRGDCPFLLRAAARQT